MKIENNVFVNDGGMGRILISSNFLRGTKYEDFDSTDIYMEVENLIDGLDPKFKALGKSLALCEIIYKNKDNMDIQMLIAAYITILK